MKNPPKPEDEEELNSWSSHIAFLKRRKAYALIEKERYEEAKNFISSELLNDSQCAEFAQGELNYINKLLKR